MIFLTKNIETHGKHLTAGTWIDPVLPTDKITELVASGHAFDDGVAWEEEDENGDITIGSDSGTAVTGVMVVNNVPAKQNAIPANPNPTTKK
ncbi:hypothetical protein [Yersinia proxima]|uniref:hypothetical protein n=1 Tax=Yersinia proxima TaxID=2890316 RepID=UPI0037CCCA77